MRKWAVLGVVLFVFLAASLMGASAVAVSSSDGALAFSYGKASETVINEALQNCESNFNQKRDCKLFLLCSGGGFGAIVQSRNFDDSWAMGASCGFADQMSAQQAAYTECKKQGGEVCQTFKHWQDKGTPAEGRAAGLSGKKGEEANNATVLDTSLPAPQQLAPAEGSVFDHFPRETWLVWEPVRGASSYVVEVEILYLSQRTWNPMIKRAGITATRYAVHFRGAQPGRWRVWAVDAKSQEGRKSPWRNFRYTQ